MSDEEDAEDPPRSPEKSTNRPIAPFRPDRFMNVELENNQHIDLTNVFYAIREENKTKEELQVELCDSIHIESFASNLVHRNRDLIRRITQTLEDWGFENQRHVAKRQEILGKRVIRALLDEDVEGRAIEILINTRTENRTIDFP